MRKCCTLLLLLLTVMGMIVAEAEVIDSFSDVDGWLYTWMEEANWSLTNEKRLDVTLSCAGTEYKSYYWYGFGSSLENGYDDYIGEIELETSCGSSLAVDSAAFSVIKNGRSVISQREVADKCTWVVPEAAADMVTTQDNAITFDEPGDYTVTLQYLSLDPWNTVLEKSGSWVKCHVVVAEQNATVKLYSTTTEQEIKSLIHTFGSYSWEGEKEDNYDSLKMVFSVNSSKDDLNVEVTLPDGFSFAPDKLETHRPIALSRNDSGELTGEDTIYPIYSTEETCVLSYTYNGEEGKVSIPVYNNPDEGRILMRPTSAVNRQDKKAFEIVAKHFEPEKDFTGSSSVYSQNLAEIACMLSQSVYNENTNEKSDRSYIESSLHNLGFTRVGWKDSSSKHDVAAAYGLKKIVSEGKVYTVVAVAVRGTVDKEWIGNFNVVSGGGQYHKDFEKCAKNLRESLGSYISAKHIPESTMKLFFAAHSRAGAVVDYAAHFLNSEYASKNIYAYTFAAPNVTKDPVEDANIINIIYKYDFVPYVPLDYGKYGVTVAVGGDHWDDAPDTVKKLFSKYTNGNEYHEVGSDFLIHILAYLPYSWKEAVSGLSTRYQNLIGLLLLKQGVADNFIAKAHGAENYCAWIVGDGIKHGKTFDYFINNDMRDAKKFVASYKRLPKDVRKKIELGLKTAWGVTTLTAPIILQNPVLAKGISSMALSWLEKVLLELDAVEVDADYYADRVFQIGCPVDIKIVDESGKTIGSFTDHEEKKALSEIGVITLGDGESSYIVIPKEIKNTIIITGKDEGNMTISYACIDEEGDTLAEGTVADIPVNKGEKFTLNNQNSDDDMPLVVSSTGKVYAAGESDKLMILPADLTSIQDEAFAGVAVEKVVIPASCEYIGHRAFANCKSLKIVQFIDGDNVDVEEDFLKGSPNARIVAPEGSYMAAWQ